jgi:hypothetical protein
MFYFDLFQWIIGTFLLLILGHILYPMVCEILFSNPYLDLIEFEINYNYNYRRTFLTWKRNTDGIKFCNISYWNSDTNSF